ncbi:Uncharacterized protein conserved in bacteria [Kingella denitrificans]|uniref:Toxin-antitoxin system, toxin component, RelE family n=1 Tax=Kingella denitrificans ATCC 33394 TaxID=888741 RepID=F0EYD2_9NEIS|nr:type II toxin-antitoxin system RelE/ParE family toxin [Kingella denitrificans]EGC17540.1 toxin-antitoxin system, toxin component, RelE family [Kingella denitrificans ATCC 33394]QQB41536.1 type II toxin-antitoxin system RelE/ParE family toxin [Kingella denitrificans]STR12621.1 Uncharacterized protein conserved in bacteria [Kingella denitrificans]
MRIFKYRNFAKFADRQHIDDEDLLDAVLRAERGLIDADLGGGVIKQRIARQGQGKSGGFRSIILFKHESRAFFVYAFAKNERSNISGKELAVYRDLAAQLLHLDDEILAELLAQNEYTELIK